MSIITKRHGKILKLSRNKCNHMARSRTRSEVVSRSSGDRYLELVQLVPLRPIRTDCELDRAIAMIDKLLDQKERSQDEEDYLDVLSNLVEKYEDEHEPLPPVTGAAMLRFLIESQDTSQAKLSSDTGIAESTISEILAGKRELNRKHIEALSRHFHVNPAVFMSETSPAIRPRATGRPAGKRVPGGG